MLPAKVRSLSSSRNVQLSIDHRLFENKRRPSSEPAISLDPGPLSSSQKPIQACPAVF
jgi:hypothetical protein